MWENSEYCWVVFCKNWLFHLKQNLIYRHRIILSETDAVSPRPPISESFTVCCDVCHRDYLYSSSDVLRYEQKVPDSFRPHPLFSEDRQ
jgi:hypothetical protein